MAFISVLLILFDRNWNIMNMTWHGNDGMKILGCNNNYSLNNTFTNGCSDYNCMYNCMVYTLELTTVSAV